METLRIAVVGAGLIGRRHIELAMANPRCELAVVVDIEHLDLSVPVVTEVAALAEHDVDGAIISTPTSMHEGHTTACLQLGLPVLIEKPATASVEAARRIERSAQDCGLPALVGYVRRHHPSVAAAKQLIDDGRLGDVLAMNALWCAAKPEQYFATSKWRSGGSGGPLMINISHDLDVMRYLLGDIKELSAYGGKARREPGQNDTAALAMRFASGAVGTVTMSDIAAAPWSWELTAPDKTSFNHPKTGLDCYQVCGTRASLGLPSLTLWQHEGEPDWTCPIDSVKLSQAEASAMEIQLNHFLDVIEGKAAPLTTIADAARTLEAVVTALAKLSPPQA